MGNNYTQRFRYLRPDIFGYCSAGGNVDLAVGCSKQISWVDERMQTGSCLSSCALILFDRFVTHQLILDGSSRGYELDVPRSNKTDTPCMEVLSKRTFFKSSSHWRLLGQKNNQMFHPRSHFVNRVCARVFVSFLHESCIKHVLLMMVKKQKDY